MTLQFRTLALTALLTIVLAPAAHAYVNPYDVLLANELLLPPQPRMTEDRLDRQQLESAARREEEQAAIFAEQQPPAVVQLESETEGESHTAASEETTASTPESMELLSLMRALERIKTSQAQAKAEEAVRQQAFLLLQQNGIELHGGAPLLQGKGNNLAPTGAGTVAAVILALAGIAWTMRRAYRSSRLAHTHS
ncbi:MAG: hypothetical protein PHU04_01100 [Candidatus Peribacteraceae bacterium]|nr:hypothetical protein [Candidatus Peribacteraceae bacterium]